MDTYHHEHADFSIRWQFIKGAFYSNNYRKVRENTKFETNADGTWFMNNRRILGCAYANAIKLISTIIWIMIGIGILSNMAQYGELSIEPHRVFASRIYPLSTTPSFTTSPSPPANSSQPPPFPRRSGLPAGLLRNGRGPGRGADR